MLLHVFHVDTGTMIKFDVGLVLDTVSNLKVEIEKKCGIPCEKQVLLASGGQTLESSERVGTYYAGTDTSPIFLFSKLAIENQIPPEPSVDYGPDPDMKTEISAAMNLPPTINTVRVRSLLAQKLCDLAGEQLRILDNLVHDQHLQQQGWAAVIANLDDVTSLFRSRSESFDHNFKQHLQSREQYIEILESFQCDIETLSKIPVLPALLEAEIANASTSDGESVGSKSGGSGSVSSDTRAGVDGITDSGNVSLPFGGTFVSSEGQVTLLQWIANKDKQASLHQLAEQCKKGISQFDEKAVESLMAEVETALAAATAVDMREIKGLEDRLFGLENLRHEANNIVKEQSDLANAFVLNENSVSNLGGDESILPDLCMSHRQQLVVMLKNHQQLRDIRHRCVRAKKELAANLFLRLRWVMFVQCKVFETDGRLVMHHENVKKLRRHLEVLQQVHTAPTVYLNAVSEVVRRRAFSQAFLLWGSEVSTQVCSVHSEEVERRKEFHSKFQGHFLSSLFPGLEDIPPPFATHPPPLFDSNLPKLSMEDIEALRSQLPDLALSLSVPDLASVTQFFMSHSKAELANQAVSHTNTCSNEKIVGVVGATHLDGNLLQPTDNSQSSAQSATQPISDRGFESETDTEDLENITSHEVPLLKNGRKRKEGCLASDAEEAKKAVEWLSAAGDSVLRLKADVAHLRDWVLCQKSDLHNMFAALSMQNQYLSKEVEGKNVEIRCLEGRIGDLEAALRVAVDQRGRDTTDQEAALEAARSQGEAAATERLLLTHRAELEAARLRYRLMTSSQALERSTSESSLHPCPKKGDFIERSEYEAMLAQVKQEMEQENNAVIQRLNAEWEKRLAHDALVYDQKAQSIANELIRINNDKTSQLNELRSRCDMEVSSSGPCISCGSSMMATSSTMSGSMALSVATTIGSVHQQPMDADSDRPHSPAASMGSSSVTIISSGQPMESSTRSRDGSGSAESSPRSSSKDKLVN